MSAFWFNRLGHVIENHTLATTLEGMPAGVRAQIAQYWETTLKDRTLLVRKAKVVPLEAIVRGYITGESASFSSSESTINGYWTEHRLRVGRIPEEWDCTWHTAA